MPLAVAPIAALLASSPVVAAGVLPTATATTNTEIVPHVKCTPRPAQAAAMKHKYPSSRAMTGPSIAAIVSSRSAPPVAARIRTAIAAILVGEEDAVGVMTAILAGKLL